MMVPNRPTALGRELGKEVARLADRCESLIREQFPNAPERCKSCAFRLGTFPNGCEATLADAMKCLAEKSPFYCHEKPHAEEPNRLCAGYAAAMIATQGMPTMPVPFYISAICASAFFAGALYGVQQCR